MYEKNYLATTSTGVLVAATRYSYGCFLQTLFESPYKYFTWRLKKICWSVKHYFKLIT